MSVPGPVLGPSVSWIDAGDVAACCGIALDGSDQSLLDAVAVEASMLMFELSGRQFPGLTDRKVRPCRQTCMCFGSTVSSGSGPWYWTSSFFGGPGGTWSNECGDKCGCGVISRVKLAGIPVREILEVKIDGVVLAPDDPDGGYRLDGWKWLTRMADPGPPVRENFWPVCQDMSLNDDQPGTFSISYRWGVNPPPLGLRAAEQLACQLWLSCSDEGCLLPAGVTELTRDGVRIQRGLLANFLDPNTPTGLVAVDAFIRAYGVRGARRRPSVWSPDLQQFARRVGT